MEFSNTGGMRSPFSPRVRQSISGRKSISMSTRKNQGKFLQPNSPQTGDVIYKTPMSTYETYGPPLPVMVTETLTFASSDVSVRISPCGWCWLVAGRRVVAWARDDVAPARELALPQTDLAHKADLVEMFYEDGAQMPSMVGVSPEGVVRYWWSVGHESASVDVSCELAGQEGHRLVGGRGCLLLATTTCSVLLLHARRSEGRASVTVRVLRPPSGWLGGLGRRVSLLFFGSMPHADTKLVGMVMLSEGALGAEAGEDGEQTGLLAVVGSSVAGPLLQLWAGATLAEHCLRRALADRHAELGSVELTALDVRAGEGERALLVLLAVGDLREPELRYALAHISVEDPTSPRVVSVQTLRWGGAGARLLPLSRAALLYGRAGLARLGTSANDKVDMVDVSCEGDSILAAEVCDGVPLVFSRKHGLLALVAAEPLLPSVCDSPMDSPCPSDMYDGNLSLYEIDPYEVAAVSSDAAGKLKAAFLLWVRRAEGACAELLGQLGAAPPGLAVGLARQLLDDVPAGDPRWPARGHSLPLGASAALRHDQQLADKARALALYRSFLRARLVPVLPPAEAASMERSLAVLAGELAMVRELRRLHDGPDADMITAAIYQVVCGSERCVELEPEVEGALGAGALAPADVLYCRVTAARALLPLLARQTPAAAAAALLHQILAAGQQARCQWGEVAVGSELDVLSPLVQLVRRTVSEAMQSSVAGVRWSAVEAAAALAHQLLADHPRADHRVRADLIRPFVEAGLTERARVLAENFGDYELLVELCLKDEDMDRLYEYIDKYADEGVAEIAFARVLQRGGAALARLLRAGGGAAGGGGAGAVGARLAAWLRAPGRRPLLALQQLAADEHGAAADTLAHLAADDTRSLSRMTTTASLAKLCLLASDGSEPADCEPCAVRRKVEDCLALAEQHASLPRALRLHHGLDDDKVLLPEDVVEMYVTSESTLTEYDLKKALDLTDLVRDLHTRDALRMKVWCSSVARDSWDDTGADHVLRDKLVFRLATLVLLLGGELELWLPPYQELVSAPQLSQLAAAPRFRYLLQCGYHALLHRDTLAA